MPPPNGTDPYAQFVENLASLQLQRQTESDRTTAIQAFRTAVQPNTPAEVVVQALYESWRTWITAALTRTRLPNAMEIAEQLWEEPAHITIGRFTDHYFAYDRFSRDACRVYGTKFRRSAAL